jgi:hypothetical protein
MLDIVNILQYIAEIRCDKTINCIESAIDCLIWLLDRWAFETGTLRGVAPQFVPSNDSAAGGQRAF